MTLSATHPTLFATLWPVTRSQPLRLLATALAGSLLLALSAKIQVPFWPVPMTMQTLAVLVLGMALGSRLGAATVALYLAEGAAGLPVFAGTPEKGIGLAYMMGPTGGYLVGFLLAALVVGWLAERGWDRTIWRAGATMLIGHALCFVPGVAWLAVSFGWATAIKVGLTPFWAATILKTALGLALMPLAWRWLGRRAA